MQKKILLDHGSGGKASHELTRELFREEFKNEILDPLEDSALLTIKGNRLAFSTDSFVVDPIFFPGGNIGDLAVNGTVNDLAMRGAKPLYLSAGMILEEGLLFDDLKTIVQSMKTAADAAGVEIVTGDTKVVPVGKADRIFINTTGIGVMEHDMDISGCNAKPGDHIIMSGSIADHGITILCQQEGLNITGAFQTDSAPMNHIVSEMIKKNGNSIHVLRDPTRGGVATTLNELAASSKVGIRIREKDLFIREEVKGACELLGLDPLYLANEGKFLAFVSSEASSDIVEIIRRFPKGKDARIIGQATEDHPGRVVLETTLGTSRIVDMLHGMPLPRIC